VSRVDAAEPAHRAGGMSEFRRAFSSLQVYNYRLYFFGQMASMTGTWMQRLAQAWLVLQITNSPLALGTVITLQALPVTLLTLFGGVVADRVPKRTLLLITQSVSTVQATLLALLTTLGMIHLWHLYVLAALLGTCTAFDAPASQAFPIELVGREEVGNAVALNSTINNMSRILGPSLAGVVIAAIGVAGCFWLNAFSFMAVLGALLAMRTSEFHALPEYQIGSARRLLSDGIRYSLRTPSVLVLLGTVLFIGTFGYNFNTILPLTATYLLHTTSFQYGFLFTALGAGSLLAALGLAYRGGQSDRRVFIGGGCFMASLGLLGFSHIYPLSLGLLLVIGVASIIYSASTQTRLQLIVPNEVRGRVMGIYTLLQQGSTPVGALFIGGLSQRLGVGTAIESAAAIGGLGLLGTYIYSRFRARER
jgi:MFS family permease